MKNWIRKIAWNIFTAFILIYLLIYYQYIYNAIIGNYEYYDSDIKSLKEYLNVTLLKWDNLLLPAFSLIFILIPFQLIKDYKYNVNKKLSFISKVLLLFSILSLLILIFGFFIHKIWDNPLDILKYLIFALILSLLLTSFLYFTIDRYVERWPTKDIQQSSKFDIVEKPSLIILLIVVVIFIYLILIYI